MYINIRDARKVILIDDLPDTQIPSQTYTVYQIEYVHYNET